MARIARTAFLIAAVVTGLLLPATSARACSCAAGDPRASLMEAGAAFVGEIASVLGDAATFRVTHDVKGNLEDHVVVHGRGDGAACGFSAAEGERGFLLYVDGGVWRSNLCAEMDPDILLRAAAPFPEPDGRGPIRFLVGGGFGDVRVIALDERGRTLSYGTGRGRVLDVATCPGATYAVESVEDGRVGLVAVRELGTFVIQREVAVVTERDFANVGRVACVDEEASQVAVVQWPRDTVARIHLVEGRESRVVFEAPAHDVTLDGAVAYVHLREEGALARVDVRTGASEAVVDVPIGVTGISLSPDGRRAAGFRYGGDSDAQPAEVVVVDVVSGAMRSVALDGWNEIGDVHWLDASTLVYLPGGGDHDVVHVYDADLAELGSFDGWQTSESAVRDGVAYGVGWGTMMTAELPNGPTRVTREFDSPETFAFVTVPGDALVREGRDDVPPFDLGAVADVPARRGRDRGASAVWLVPVALAGVVALGLALARRRRSAGRA